MQAWQAKVDCDPELLALLRGWCAEAHGVCVIESKRKARYHKAPVGYYRCNESFRTLYAWLAKQGVKDQKPLHTLRKELGSVLANEQGIFAAQQVLRHAHIQTTARHYTDKRRSITAGLGALLRDVAETAKVIEFPALEATTPKVVKPATKRGAKTTPSRCCSLAIGATTGCSESNKIRSIRSIEPAVMKNPRWQSTRRNCPH